MKFPDNVIKTETIYKYLEEHKLTKKEFCLKAGISIGTLNEILKFGNGKHKLNTVRKILKVLEIRCDDFLNRKSI